jgi:hypothetical protein
MMRSNGLIWFGAVIGCLGVLGCESTAEDPVGGAPPMEVAPDAGPPADPSCVAESNEEFCARLELECGHVTKPDNCGERRYVASCGTCPTGTECSGNYCVVVGPSPSTPSPPPPPPPPSSSSCPLNTPTSALGLLGSGSFLDRSDMFTGSQPCQFYGRDAVYVWTAPAAGLYDFKITTVEEDVLQGSGTHNMLYNLGVVSLLEGSTCAASLMTIDCSQGTGTHYVRHLMAAGQSVLVVGSIGVSTDWANGYITVSATYELSVTTCTPQCSGKECGPDTCGGTCGTCGAGESCSSAGQCQCVPQCSGKQCGPDGCGGICGSCPSGGTCSSTGQCSQCVPSCSGRTCGGDGCGGTCGSCGSGQVCTLGGSCACDPVADTGCGVQSCHLLSSQTPYCESSGSSTGSCSTTSSCAGGYGCFAGQCRKICRDDGDCAGSEVCAHVSGWSTYGACG